MLVLETIMQKVVSFHFSHTDIVSKKADADNNNLQCYIS